MSTGDAGGGDDDGIDLGRAGACAGCLSRTWLIARLAGHLEVGRARIDALLALPDEDLVRAVAGRDRSAVERERGEFRPAVAREAADRAGQTLVCRCREAYPRRLLDLPAPPAVLHLVGPLERFLEACERDPVAVVGTRDPTVYGAAIAEGLGRRLAAAGVAVLSGMARGIDAAAHRGALGWGMPGAPSSSLEPVSCPAIAVLPGGADRPYPRGNRVLYSALARSGSVVSELPPGTGVRRWMFPARNRIIAALSELTVVVEAERHSGSLVTSRVAGELGRYVGAVPGRVTTPQASGPLELLAGGAVIIRDAQDAIDALFGAGVHEPPEDGRAPLSEGQAALLRELEGSGDASSALARAGLGADRGLAELAALELAGWIRRGPGGRYSVIP